ncbi:hypothetical protein BGZ70_000759 [Mortierella alpina]|uniref:RNA methyltransferase n=1 Tax=Mortierella alpina TaxID=64518 RepID=A0A9P6IXP3_MORAP|nr:hypothetical protein BGZ70_000759 [Mortierella alpina]
MAKNSSTTANNSRTKNGKHKQDASDGKSDQAAKRTKSSRNKTTQEDTSGTSAKAASEAATEASTGSSMASEAASTAPATAAPSDSSLKITVIQSTSEQSNAKVIASPTAVPKLLPRVVVASGFLPRKDLLKKTTASSSIASGGSRTITGGTVGAPNSSTTSTIFRAKDIVRTTITPSSSFSSSTTTSQSFHTHNASQASHQHYQSSSLPMNGHLQQDKGGNDQSTSLVKATALKPLKPIVVIPEQHPDRVVFPYGNYPTYYEKRSQEQSKPKTTGKADSASSTNANISGSSNQAAVRQQAKPPKWRQEEQYPKPQHSSNRGLSVLLPPSTAGHERSSSGSNGRREDGMAVRDLAKKVDLRLEFLEPSWFRGKRVLDIGCNAALLSVFIAMHYKPCKIQGVDIDPSLIVKAEKFVRQTYSQISPQAYTQQASTPSTREQNQDKTSEPQDVPYESYFPKALQLMHGWLPIPQKTEQTQALFPHNIEFRVADWVTEMASKEDSDLEQWDVIIGFSLTKWIHLHHGDDGIKRFFRDVYRSLAPGGLFLVEPQAYSTYNRRSKILPKMKENYNAMIFMPKHFRDYLLSDEVGFREGVLLGHSEGNAKNFNRDIYSFRK